MVSFPGLPPRGDGILHAQDQKKIDEYFNMSISELMEVEVYTAGKTLEKIGDIPASMVIVSREEIERFGYQSLLEILQNIPGLYGIGNSVGLYFGVRGFFSEGTCLIVLVDGVTQISDANAVYAPDDIGIPVEAIERVEVVRGPMSVLYGTGAFFGVINIITKADAPDDQFNMITASVGSYKTKKTTARFSGTSGDFSYTFNAAYLDSYGLDVPYGHVMTDPSMLQFYGLPIDARTGGNLEMKSKFFNFSGEFKNFYVDLQYAESQKEPFVFLPSQARGHTWSPVHARVAFGYRKQLSKSYSMDGKVTFFRNRILMKFDWFEANSYAIQQTDSNTMEMELNNYFTFSPKFSATAGIYYKSLMDASLVADFESLGTLNLTNSMFESTDNINTFALYLQAGYKPNKKLNLVAGVRMEYVSPYSLKGSQAYNTDLYSFNEATFDPGAMEFIPRLAVIYKLNKNNIFKFLYGKAVNRPSFFQVFQNIVMEIQYNHLEPEYIDTFELNLLSSLSDNIDITLSVFHNTLDNLIVREVYLEDGVFRSVEVNSGKLVTRGAEFTLQVRPLDFFKLEVSGIYQKTEDKRPDFKDDTVGNSPTFLGYFKASARLKKKLTLSMSGRYVGEMETTYDVALLNPDGSVGGRIGRKVPGYFSLDANLRLERLFGTGLFLNLKCSNLADTEIRYPTLPQNTWADRGLLDPGRSFFFTLGMKF
ncbi:MAG: TonB-dependent receptor [bacterium]|nr:TonB-dependent receptor [bacterium]